GVWPFFEGFGASEPASHPRVAITSPPSRRPCARCRPAYCGSAAYAGTSSRLAQQASDAAAVAPPLGGEGGYLDRYEVYRPGSPPCYRHRYHLGYRPFGGRDTPAVFRPAG